MDSLAQPTCILVYIECHPAPGGSPFKLSLGLHSSQLSPISPFPLRASVWWFVLGVYLWSPHYMVPGAKCITTATNLETNQLPDGAHPPMLPVEIPAGFDHSVEPSNCVSIVPVHSTNTTTSLTPVSDLTKEDDIVVSMGPGTPGNDLCDTIDMSPLYYTVSPSFLVLHIA